MLKWISSVIFIGEGFKPSRLVFAFEVVQYEKLTHVII